MALLTFCLSVQEEFQWQNSRYKVSIGRGGNLETELSLFTTLAVNLGCMLQQWPPGWLYSLLHCFSLHLWPSKKDSTLLSDKPVMIIAEHELTSTRASLPTKLVAFKVAYVL